VWWATNIDFVENLLLFEAVKEFCKSTKNWQSYSHGYSGTLFWLIVYIWTQKWNRHYRNPGSVITSKSMHCSYVVKLFEIIKLMSYNSYFTLMLAAGVSATTDWYTTSTNLYASALEIQEIAGIYLHYTELISRLSVK